MRLAHPYYLFLLLLIPGLIYWALQRRTKRTLKGANITH